MCFNQIKRANFKTCHIQKALSGFGIGFGFFVQQTEIICPWFLRKMCEKCDVSKLATNNNFKDFLIYYWQNNLIIYSCLYSGVDSKEKYKILRVNKKLTFCFGIIQLFSSKHYEWINKWMMFSNIQEQINVYI